MRTGRPVAKIELSAEVTSILEGYTRRGKTAQSLALRARIVLGCASGLSNKAVAARERVTGQTVGKWRRRFLERGVDGLLDEPRPGVPRKIDDAKVESIIVQTLESQPRGAPHWSTRSMARHSGISTSSVGRIWRAFGLQPHRVETFKLSTDPRSSTRCATSSGSTSTHPTAPWCCASTRNRKFRHSTAPSRCCRCVPVRSSGAAMTTRSRHHLVVRRSGYRHRPCHRPLLPTSPRGRIPQVPDRGRAGRAGRSRHPSGARQLRHPQGPARESVARPPPALSPPLHPDQRLLAQSSRTLVCSPRRQADQARRPSQHLRSQGRHCGVKAHNDDPKPFIWTKTADAILQTIARCCTDTLAIHAPIS